MNRQDFWIEVFKFNGSVTPYILGRVMFFTFFSCLIWVLDEYTHFESGLAVAPYEIVGVVLALLLVIRTNAGYDRWYEGRKLWGGIVNQCRNLSLIGTTYGPSDARWQDGFARWISAFPHACRHSLRGERNLEDMVPLLKREEAEQLAGAQHLPMYVAGKMAEFLRKAVDKGDLDRFAFIQAEHERAALIDHIGACERIAATPLAEVFSIKIRRFLFLYLTVLPVAIVDKTGMMTPFVVAIVAYPLLSLDQIGIELQSPFLADRLSHLPLETISNNIENNVLKYLQQSEYGILSTTPDALSDVSTTKESSPTLSQLAVAEKAELSRVTS